MRNGVLIALLAMFWCTSLNSQEISNSALGTLSALSIPIEKCPAGYSKGEFAIHPAPLAAGIVTLSIVDYNRLALGSSPAPGYCKVGQAYSFASAAVWDIVPIKWPICSSMDFIEKQLGDQLCALRKDTAAENTVLAVKVAAAQAQIDRLTADVAAAATREAALQKTVEALRLCATQRTRCKD